MRDEIIIEISQSFKTGTLNTSRFKDIPFMTDDELKRLFDFIQAVKKGDKLRGKNKPSWLRDDLTEIPNTEIYQQQNQWHYHCGEYVPSKYYNPVANLKMNLLGETSSAVIHYQKISDNHIFIVAYSPNHEPFPKITDYPNPIIERIK